MLQIDKPADTIEPQRISALPPTAFGAGSSGVKDLHKQVREIKESAAEQTPELHFPREHRVPDGFLRYRRQPNTILEILLFHLV